MRKVNVKVNDNLLCKAEYIDSGLKLGTGLMFTKKPKSIEYESHPKKSHPMSEPVKNNNCATLTHRMTGQAKNVNRAANTHQMTVQAFDRIQSSDELNN